MSSLASTLRSSGRDARIVSPVGDGTGDLSEQSEHLGDTVDQVLAETGALSVDVIGYFRRRSDLARLDSALNLVVQDFCPAATTSHGELPTDPVVLAALDSLLGAGPPAVSTGLSC